MSLVLLSELLILVLCVRLAPLAVAGVCVWQTAAARVCGSQLRLVCVQVLDSLKCATQDEIQYS